ncbi:hypothetical protein P7C73_g5136, partial [Tremellales sp. Uapishka_1]
MRFLALPATLFTLLLLPAAMAAVSAAGPSATLQARTPRPTSATDPEYLAALAAHHKRSRTRRKGSGLPLTNAERLRQHLPLKPAKGVWEQPAAGVDSDGEELDTDDGF